MLSNIRIVLVNTSHPGNIGAVARAMKNMCLGELALVNPIRFPDAEATARASGADDVLANATVCDSLGEAITGCHLVFGVSARARSLTWPQLTPRECASVALREGARAPVALVFGRENSGLTNVELERCNYLVSIPSNPAYSSLNVAAAVQVLAYELLLASGAYLPVASSESIRRVTADEMEGFYRHLEQTLLRIGFLASGNPRLVMRRLRRLFNRAHLDENELNILRGVFKAVQKRAE